MKNNKFIDLSSLKRIPLPSILDRLGLTPVARYEYYWMYRAPWREDREASMCVWLNNNTWKDFGDADSHAASNIDLVMRMGFANDWGTAAGWINTHITGGVVIQNYTAIGHADNYLKRKNNSASRIMDVSPLYDDGLLAYGESRGISKEVLSRYCRQVTFMSSGGNTVRAIGFENTKGGFALRNGEGLKCNIGPGSFSCVLEKSKGFTYVFEGFFDFLSFRMIYPEIVADYHILNSVTNIGGLVSQLKSADYLSIKCFLDTDAAGVKAVNAICVELHDKSVEDMSPLYSDAHCKDLNEFLITKLYKK